MTPESAEERWWRLSKDEWMRCRVEDAAAWEADADAWEAADAEVDWTADPQ